MSDCFRGVYFNMMTKCLLHSYVCCAVTVDTDALFYPITGTGSSAANVAIIMVL